MIERTKTDYYLALRRTQSTLRTPNQDWQPWLEYFLGAMAEQVAQLEQRRAALALAGDSKTDARAALERQADLLALLVAAVPKKRWTRR